MQLKHYLDMVLLQYRKKTNLFVTGYYFMVIFWVRYLLFLWNGKELLVFCQVLCDVVFQVEDQLEVLVV